MKHNPFFSGPGGSPSLRDVSIEVPYPDLYKAYYETTSEGKVIPLDAPGAKLKFFSARAHRDDGIAITAKFKLPEGTKTWKFVKRIIIEDAIFERVGTDAVGDLKVTENITLYQTDGNGVPVKDANGNLIPIGTGDEIKVRGVTKPIIGKDGSSLPGNVGYHITASVTFPVKYGTPETGKWFFRQIVTPNDAVYTQKKIYDLGATKQNKPGLDYGLYLPGPAPFNCKSGSRSFVDSPGIVLSSDTVHDTQDPLQYVSMDQKLTLYVMFQPPANGAEFYSVPLYSRAWTAFGRATKRTQGWSIGTPDECTLGVRTLFPPFPTWNLFHPVNEPIVSRDRT